MQFHTNLFPHDNFPSGQMRSEQLKALADPTMKEAKPSLGERARKLLCWRGRGHCFSSDDFFMER